ncbi:MAG: MFS transporter [Candidatus Thorarchaeota archaeon]
MTEAYERFCVDSDGLVDLPDSKKQRNRLVGYLITFLVTFTLGTTEIFAPWYADALGGGAFESGWAMGSFGIVYMFSPAIGGRISDKIGRKMSIILSTMAYISVLVIYPFSTLPIHLILIRGLEGFVYGLLIPGVQGMVAELSTGSEAATLGNFSTSWSAGMILSPLVLAYVTGVYGTFSSIYIVIAVEVVSLGLMSVLLQNYSKKPETSERPVEVAPTGTKTYSRTSNRFIASYLSIALWGVVSTVLLALFPLYIGELPGFGGSDFGVLLMIWNAMRTVAFIFCTRLPEESMGALMVVGAMLSGVSSLMIFVVADFWVFVVAMTLSGFGVGFGYLSALYLVVSATENEKGTNAGLVESMGGVGLFAGPIFGGWLMDLSRPASLGYPFLMCAVLAAIVLVVMVLLLRRR